MTEPQCPSCDELRELLYAVSDHELEPQVEDALWAHAAQCGRCTDLLDAQQHLRELIRRCYQQQASQELRARVVTRIRSTHIRIERWD